MFNPAHPGEVIRELCIEPLELTVTETAKALGVTRKALSELLIAIPA
jgi:antitoxin HigA-1